MDIAGLLPADRNVEGVVEMMLDAVTSGFGRLLLYAVTEVVGPVSAS